MTIRSEIVAFLDEQIKEHPSVDKPRNINLICYYYGFGGASLPTLDETAEQFDGIRTRERVRQILNRDFRDPVTAADIPSARRFLSVVNGEPYWTLSKLDQVILDDGVAGDTFSIPGMLRLCSDLGLTQSYAVFTPELEPATRGTLRTYEEHFVLPENDLFRLRKLLRVAKRAQGLRGIVRYDDLESEDTDFSSKRDLMIAIIRHIPSSWIRTEGDGLWYMFEDFENTLVNHGRKALTAFSDCDPKYLAQSIHTAMSRRPNRFEYPSVELISDYLRTSVHFDFAHDRIRLLGQPMQMSEIEEQLNDYLQEHGGIRYTSGRTFLEEQGHEKPNIDRVLTQSPLVFVDKSRGRGNYTYHAVGSLTNDTTQQIIDEEQYAISRRRLREIHRTDDESQQSVRREQYILRQWLFAEKEEEKCALCGEIFSVGALVAAHKKKRSECNDAERRDPYIVMPLCLFGCDYLYENQHIFVDGGTLMEGIPLKQSGVERVYLEKIMGRKLDTRWLRGELSYFHRPITVVSS